MHLMYQQINIFDEIVKLQPDIVLVGIKSGGVPIANAIKSKIDLTNEKIFDIHLKTTENKEIIKIKYISNIRK